MGSNTSTAQPKERPSSGNLDASSAVRQEKDHASPPTKAKVEEKERQNSEGQNVEGAHEDCFHGKHCQWCSLSFPGQL